MFHAQIPALVALEISVSACIHLRPLLPRREYNEGLRPSKTTPLTHTVSGRSLGEHWILVSFDGILLRCDLRLPFVQAPLVLTSSYLGLVSVTSCSLPFRLAYLKRIDPRLSLDPELPSPFTPMSRISARTEWCAPRILSAVTGIGLELEGCIGGHSYRA